MTEENYFNIHEIIAKGKTLVKPYELPNDMGTVYIRPLTELEMDECDARMLEVIADPETRKFAFNYTPEVFDDPEFDFSEINIAEFTKASGEVLYYMAFLSMKDFTDDLTLDLVKALPGIRDLAVEVKKMSGYDEDVVEEIEEFR